jgi:thiamine pyrophosphate-dependent acetolactate synthase large subunit-like protein
MGVRLGQAIATAVYPDRPVVHHFGDSAIGFSGIGMETLVCYNSRSKTCPRGGADRGVEQWQHRPRPARDPGQPDVLTCGPTR